MRSSPLREIDLINYKNEMTSELWEKVKRLFDAATALAPAMRENFLIKACGADDELRREVENLLASFDEAESFMDKPAAAEVASLIIEKNAKFKCGEQVAHYKIVLQIGEGGMGEVYLAKDTRLNRKVALKVLPANLTSDKSRLQRFKQEAQAASNLNHPNIITIYEFREYDGTHLIATEFVEGETLRQKLSGENPNLNEIFEIVIQIASALSVAHLAGVIHRDIKPENIMIRPDRIVKLLDFGLAKLAGADGAKLLDVSTQNLTNPGMVMGTVNYMSPEQAQGAKVDRRTDLWSLGVLLYEMIAGNQPFSGKTVNHTLVAIMEQQPAPLREKNPAVSADLEFVVNKLLEKGLLKRYSTADDLLADLQELKTKSYVNSRIGETTAVFENTAITFSGSGQFVRSIAVLPFLTLGLTETEEYLGLGLADALITQLSRTKKLAVRPTSAVRGFVNSDKDSTEIGHLLNVGSILEGNLQRIGKRLRVTVQVVDVESKNSLWAKKFDIEFADIFAVEDEITTKVADALLLNLNSDEYRQIEARGTNNVEAYRFYLQGRYFWNKYIPEDLPKAIEAFEKAISLDPDFAGAYAGVARAYRHILALRNVVEWQTAREKMLRAATNALALDDALAEAHLAVAEIKMDEWNWGFAEREYKRAITLNPNLADARAGYANFLSITERFDEAFKQIKRALELDPLSNRLRNNKGKILVMAHRYDEAVELFEKAIQIEPQDALAHYFLGYAFACKEMFAEAISQYRTAIDISDASPDVFLGYAYARIGERRAALEILEKVKNKKDVSQAELAVIYIGLGEKDSAFTALEKGFEKHDLQMQYLRVEQHYDDLRGDARFVELLRRVGLSEAVKVSTDEQKSDKPTGETEKNETAIQAQPTIEGHFGKTTEIPPRKFAWYHAVFAVLILIPAIGAAWFYLNSGSFGLNNFFKKNSALSLQTMKINRLSGTSQAIEAAISPDGEFVVYIKGENGKQSLWLRQVSAASSIQIASPAEDERYGSPVFSTDGSYIYYLKVKRKEARATLYQIPKLGGDEKKMVEDISFQDSGSSFSLSPDGKQVAFIRLDDGFNRSLVVTDLDGKNERKLISRKPPEFLTGAAFSPDGKTIASVSGTFGGKSGGGMTIVSVNAADSTEKTLTDKNWATVEGLAWLDDGSGLIVSAGERPGLVQLWHISDPEGEVSRITNDLSDYAAPSLTTKTFTIAAVQTNQKSNIWVNLPDKNENAEKQLTFSNGGKDGNFGLSYAPDGSIVYTSQAGGNADLWIVNADGTSNKQLTNDAGVNYFPSVSPDGKYIVFNSDRSGKSSVWRMEIDGGNPMRLADGSLPSFSSDGKWVFYYEAGVGTLWKIPIEGGEAVRIPIREKDLATAPVISPDNRFIACNYLVGERGAQFRIGVLSIEGGEPIKIFDTFTYAVKILRWMPDSRAVSFIDTREGVSNIVKIPLDGEKEVPVTNFKTGMIWNFDWSGDGKKLALSRGNITKDIVLISDFRKSN